MPNIFADVKNWAINILEKVDSSMINIETIEGTVFARLDEFSNNLAVALPKILINGVTNLISSIGTFIIGLVIGFFLLLSYNNLSSTLLELIPKKFRNTTSELCKKINQSLRGYVNGALIDAFVVFVVSSIAFAIIGLKAPLLFGLFCGLMNVIP